MQPEIVVTTKTQVDEFCKKFEHTKFLPFPQDSMGIILVDAWFIDSGATCHMTGE